jgi:hypothetical protein
MLHEILFPLTQLSLHGFKDFFEACFQGVGVEILYSAYWNCEVWLMPITLAPNIMRAILLISIMFCANVTMHNNPSKPFKYKWVNQ